MRPASSSALTLALIYGVIGGTFIVAFDVVLHRVGASLAAEIAKNFAFIGITSTLVFVLARRYLVAAEDEAAKAIDAQEAMRASGNQLAAAQAIASLGSWELDLRSRTLQCSQQVFEILGVSPAEGDLTLSTFMALVYADDRELLADVQARTLSDGAPLRVEFRVVRPDGNVRHVQLRGTLQRDAHGAPVRQLGTMQDVTDRKSVEIELRQRNRQQTAIAELGLKALQCDTVGAFMDDAMAIAAQILAVEYTKVLELLPDLEHFRLIAGIGWRPGLVGRAVVPAGPDSQAGFTLQEDQPVVVADLRTDRRFSGPALLIDHQVVSGLSTIINAAGRPWGVLGVHTTRRQTFSAEDVSFVQSLANLIGTVVERELAQQSNAEHTFLREMATEVASLGGWSYDPMQDRILWSPELNRIFERPADFKPDFDDGLNAFVPEHRERMLHRFEVCNDQGTPYDEEAQIVTTSGRRRWVRVIGRAERDAGGRVVRLQGAVQDIDERKTLESMLHQSQRLEAIGQLTGGIAHDFNNLLTVIIGNSDLLIDADLGNTGLRELVRTSRQAALRGADLTRRLLAYARKQPLEPQPTNVAELLVNMDALLRRTLGERIEIETVRAGGLWLAMVDPAQLESAVLNLCLNARDAMPEGGRLTLETANTHLDDAYAAEHPEVDSGHYVLVAITDTGMGMSPQLAERAFEPFFTTKPAGQGSGLGLSMVYGFVKQSRGHIKLYSELGEGTSVRLYLPRASDAKAAPPVTPTKQESRFGSGELVLVVEDDELVRSFVAQQVQAMGYQVLTASGGSEALQLLDEHADVALLFTDVVMPGGMDGRQLADAARAKRPDLPVLFTSGYTENAIVHQGRLDPGVMLLSKPYRIAELADKLHQSLESSRS